MCIFHPSTILSFIMFQIQSCISQSPPFWHYSPVIQVSSPLHYYTIPLWSRFPLHSDTIPLWYRFSLPPSILKPFPLIQVSSPFWHSSLQVDVWSLGVNMYAMLVGKLPFRSSRNHSNPRAKLLQQITAGLGAHQEADAAHLHPC